MRSILQVGLGPLGRVIARDLAERGLGRVVAAVDPGDGVRGRKLSELVENADPDVTVMGSLEEVSDVPVRGAIVTTSSDLSLCMDTFRPLLRRGVAVVSTCEELAWPWLRHPIHAQELHELCVRHGARILGTGVNPGFLMDTLPVVLTTACHAVDGVWIERIQDAASRRIPFQRKIGAGLDLATFDERKADGSLRHVGLGESLFLVAHYLGWEVERWEETLSPVVADEDLECGLGRIKKGDARGVRQVARGWVGGEEKLTLVFHAAVGESEPADRIEIRGHPPLKMTLAGGVHGDVATSAIVLNQIPALLSVPPGLHTMVTLPRSGFQPPDDFAPPQR